MLWWTLKLTQSNHVTNEHVQQRLEIGVNCRKSEGDKIQIA